MRKNPPGSLRSKKRRPDTHSSICTVLPKVYDLLAVMGEGVDDSLGKRQPARTAHLERFNQPADHKAAITITAGPHPATESARAGTAGFNGSPLITEFHSLEQAQNWIDANPHVAAAVYGLSTRKLPQNPSGKRYKPPA